MRITAISDIHGSLIPIEPTDLLIIAGDWSPLEIQTKIWYMREWINDCFLPWCDQIDANRILFVAGNHDFICDPNFMQNPIPNLQNPLFKKDILWPYLRKHRLLNKITYLDCSSTTYNKLKIYGCPYVEGCLGWAFSYGEYKHIYEQIPKCDILVTHQPPLYNGLGSIEVDEVHKEFGSYDLMEAIQKRKPKYVFCGHIHEGNHEKQVYHHIDGKITEMYNCSIKNEEYNVAYKPVVIEI